MFPSLPARMSRTKRLDASSLWLILTDLSKSPRFLITEVIRKSSCPQQDNVKYKRVERTVKGRMKKNLEKSSATPTGPCFEASRLGAGILPAALALGAFDV